MSSSICVSDSPRSSESSTIKLIWSGREGGSFIMRRISDFVSILNFCTSSMNFSIPSRVCSLLGEFSKYCTVYKN